MLLYGANSPLNESNEELRMKQYVVFVFHSSCFDFFKIMQSKQRQIWSYYHLSSEDQNKCLARPARNRQRRYMSWLVNLGDQVERAVHKVRRLR